VTDSGFPTRLTLGEDLDPVPASGPAEPCPVVPCCGGGESGPGPVAVPGPGSEVPGPESRSPGPESQIELVAPTLGARPLSRRESATHFIGTYVGLIAAWVKKRRTADGRYRPQPPERLGEYRQWVRNRGWEPWIPVKLRPVVNPVEVAYHRCIGIPMCVVCGFVKGGFRRMSTGVVFLSAVIYLIVHIV
jgi:hypothetical protein